MRAGDRPGPSRDREPSDRGDADAGGPDDPEESDRAWVDGVEIPVSRLGTNDALNFGRFPGDESLVSPYTLRIPRATLLRRHASAFDRLVAELREADALDDEGPSALARMGYPSLAEAWRHPVELAEAIRVHLDREILAAAAPFEPASRYLINSTDRVVVTADTLVIGGRALRRRG